MRGLGRAFWRVAIVGVVFTLARFSEAFLILRGTDTGLPPLWAPAVLMVMSLAYAATAYPAGVLSDRVGRTVVLGTGVAILIAADLALAFIPGSPGLATGVVLWGVHMGFTQGLFAALVADHSPAALRGTAFGLFNLLTGGALLLASIVAGALWERFGYRSTFGAGAVLAGLALVGLGLDAWRVRRAGSRAG